MRTSHPLLQTLRSLQGNQRACVFTEPLWAIPNNLILPFASVYMAGIGLKDSQIGMVVSFGLVMQFVWSLFSGAIVDKYGRRRMMLIFGLVSWTIPCLIWATAQNYWYFLAAVFFNSMWRVMGNSFSCMIIENEDTNQLINIYTILNLFGILAGFIAPILGYFIDRFTLIPAMRIIYLIAMGLMTVKFLLQYRMAKESMIGRHRKEECRGESLISLTFGGWKVILSVLLQTRLILFIILMTLIECFSIVQAAFWPLFVTSNYDISTSMLSIFPLVKTFTTIFVFVIVTSHLHLHSVRRPLLIGIGIHLLGLSVLLICMPFGASALGAVFFSAVCEAFAVAILSPLCESLMSVNIPEKERARINSLITAMILLISAPAGWIAGLMSQHSRFLPLVLNLCVLSAEIIVVLAITRMKQEDNTQDSESIKV